MAQSIIVINWFSGKELSMAFGLNSSISLLGSVLNDNTEPKMVYLADSVFFGLFVGILVCLVSLAAVYLLIKIDRKRSCLLGLKDKNELAETEKFK